MGQGCVRQQHARSAQPFHTTGPPSAPLRTTSTVFCAGRRRDFIWLFGSVTYHREARFRRRAPSLPPAASISFRTVGSRSSGAASRVLPSRAPGDEMPIQPRCGIPAGLDPFKVACFIPQSCAAALIRVAGATLLMQADKNYGSQGGAAHEPYHCSVCRDCRVEHYLNRRRSRGWLWARLVLQWATVRPAG
jgi:hypothetical protein